MELFQFSILKLSQTHYIIKSPYSSPIFFLLLATVSYFFSDYIIKSITKKGTSMLDQELSIKVVIIGSVGVGKSSLAVRYVHNEFNQSLESTLGAVYLEKTILCKDRKIKYAFWDTAGQEKYKAIARIYYKDCRVALIVYDVTSKSSYNQLIGWMEQLKANAPQNVLKAIVGNKVDLQSKEEVSYDQVKQYAQSENALFVYTSAKNGKGIEEMFKMIAQKVLQTSQTKPKKNKLSRGNSKKKACC